MFKSAGRSSFRLSASCNIHYLYLIWVFLIELASLSGSCRPCCSSDVIRLVMGIPSLFMQLEHHWHFFVLRYFMSTQTQTDFCSGLIKVFDYEPDVCYHMFSQYVEQNSLILNLNRLGSSKVNIQKRKAWKWCTSSLKIRMKHGENVFKMTTFLKKKAPLRQKLLALTT